MGKIFDYDGVPVLHTTSGDLKGYFYDGVYGSAPLLAAG